MKLNALALLVNGELKGDPDTDILGVAGIHDVKEGEITFLSDAKLLEECARSKASCVIVKDFIPAMDKPQIAVKNPQYAFAQLLQHFFPRPLFAMGVSSLAFISPSAIVEKDVSIHPFAHVSDNVTIGRNTVLYPGVCIGEGTVIGNGCTIYANVTIREKVAVGNRVIIHSGSVIGSDGFGYVWEGGRHYKIPQVGGVIIGDDVEIGANVTIDRATTGNTLIGRGTKIDNLVQIAHNVTIGEHSIIVAQVGIAGSSEIGNFVTLAGQVGVPDHVKIADGCIIGAQAGVLGNLSKGIYIGSPAMPHRDWLKSTALFARLPELNKRIKELEEKITILERRNV
jgi:UDP-3-O-[3-hydroxymyristoyl] glucosamine N-acyltransferase